MTRLEVLIMKIRAVAAALEARGDKRAEYVVTVLFQPKERSGSWVARMSGMYTSQEREERGGTDVEACASLLYRLGRDASERVDETEKALRERRAQLQMVEAIVTEGGDQ